VLIFKEICPSNATAGDSVLLVLVSAAVEAMVVPVVEVVVVAVGWEISLAVVAVVVEEGVSMVVGVVVAVVVVVSLVSVSGALVVVVVSVFFCTGTLLSLARIFVASLCRWCSFLCVTVPT
jgi:hypothetical protein